MNFPNAKEIKKLADACRKAGITHFKCGDYEFTLGDKPEPETKKAREMIADPSSNTIQTDSISEEALLFWSSGGAEAETTEGDLQ